MAGSGGMPSVPDVGPGPLAATSSALGGRSSILAEASGPLAAALGGLVAIASRLGAAPGPLGKFLSVLAQAAGRLGRSWSPMGTWYIPQREGDFDAWAGNFAARIGADPAAYGLTAPDALALSLAYDLWRGAYLAAKSPGTRTAPAVAAKNTAKRALLAVVKRLAAAVRADPAVGPGLRAGLGLRVNPSPDPVLSPIPAPAEAPGLAVVGIARGAHTVRVFREEQAGGGGGGARPRGATGLLVFRAVAEDIERDPSRAAFLALVTRATFASAFSPADRGKLATYFARWTNAKGKLGPWSLPAVAPVAA
jgi:hypothetical protein